MWSNRKVLDGVWAGLATDAPSNADVVIIGVGFEGGAGGAGGASLGPDQVRELSRRGKQASRHGVDFAQLRIFDAGNVVTQRFDLAATVAHLRAVYDKVFGEVRVPVLTLGGDHSITYPIVSAAAVGSRLGLIWFDAHPDVLEEYQGSRISHGSPLRRVIDDGAVRPEDVLVVGTRAYDPGEVEYLTKLGIHEVRAADFADDRAAALATYRRRVTALAEQVDRLYISVDIDILDASVAPGTGTPVAGGIDTATLLTMLEFLPHKVAAFDVMEFAPAHDVGSMTGDAVMAIITAMLAHVGGAEHSL